MLGRWPRALLALALMACAERGKIVDGATGLAQLTAINTSFLVGQIAADESCGFRAKAVLDAVEVRGTVGSTGTATWAVRDCVLDFSTPKVLTDCAGKKVTLKGKLTVTATMSLTGVVSGQREFPIVPRSPDALTIHVSRAIAEQYDVVIDGSDVGMNMRDGTLSVTARPRLALGDQGACTAPTQDTAITNLDYRDAATFVRSPDGDQHAFISSTNLTAQVGQGPLGENTIYGGVVMVVGNVDLAKEKNIKLDPNYDRAKFVAQFECNAGLKKPLSYTCGGGDTDAQLAQGVARFSGQAFSVVTTALQLDRSCGFSSPNAAAGTTVSGRPGGLGTATTEVRRCVLDFATPTAILTDCAGNKTFLQGRATVSARSTMSGIITGQTAQPILPADPSFIRYEVSEMLLDDLVLSTSSTSAPSARFFRGKLAGKLAPRFAKSVSAQACTAPTGIARIEDLSLSDGAVQIVVPGQSLPATPAEIEDLDALSGTIGNESNTLTGTVSIAGSRFSLPAVASDPGFIPGYDRASFDRGWACGADLVTPPSFECGSFDGLAGNVARLTPLLFGGVLAAVESDARCGFQSAAVLGTAQVDGTPGGPGMVTFTIATPCEIAFATPRTQSVDCAGVVSTVSGTTRVRGTKRIRGLLTGNPQNPVVPTSRDAVSYSLESTNERFRVTASGVPADLTLISGGLSGDVAARTALDTQSGACVLPTPAARFSRLAYRDADLRLTAGEVSTVARVASSDLVAVNGEASDGAGGSATNTISGAINLLGRDYPIASGPLQTPFDAAAFQRGFACTPNLQVPASDAECAFTPGLAPIVAGLFIQNLAAATQLIVADATCGFQSFPVLGAPVAVVGMDGQPGSVTWRATACAIDRRTMAATPLAEDCFRRQTFAEGQVTVTATQTVQGLRTSQMGVPLAIPLARDGVMLALDLSFDRFAAFALARGERAPRAKLTLVGGRAVGEVAPINGESRQNPGAFTVPTPLARIRQLALSNVTATLELDGMRFDLQLAGNLDASSGVAGGMGNTLSGMLSVNGVPVPLMGALDPSYDQALFDLSYDCTPDLAATVPPN